MLNDWSCDNRNLKALVDTERFEKEFLETQLKKQDEQIQLLSALTMINNQNILLNRLFFS